MTVTRTINLSELQPEELAELFCELDGEQQANFFTEIHRIAAFWPGAGWCQQSHDIAQNSDRKAKEVVITLAEHMLDCENLEQIVYASKGTEA